MRPFPKLITDPGSALERLLLALWIGGMWTAGYVVTPVLFSSLTDRMLAGAIAGRLFGIISLVGLVCGGLLLLLHLYRRGRTDWRFWTLCTMLVITAIGEFGLAPLMQQLKQAAAGGFVPGSDIHRHFSLLHGVSSALFLVNSLLGMLLLVAPPAGRARD